ncbi:JmjC domain-containing protein [Thermotoga caldifontis]|uniref:JmjC domain-containing protein n=1 Tax=Thermotoga caldifontis TaxID=1508419 RepID=UPI000693E7B7|nr:cupin domain-containing protein [Thermotoga caldifontis]
MEPIKMSSAEKLTALIEGLQARKIQFNAPSYGKAEVHRDWHDLFVVLAGKAKVQFGELVGNIEEISPGELRSNEMKILQEIQLAEGDILLIPAGVGHRTIVEDFYSEWVFKIPARR